MIKHIVMWRLAEKAEGFTKPQLKQKVKQILENLVGKIPELGSLEVGTNFNSSDAAYDVVMYSEFNSQEDLDKYQVHPLHKEVADFIGKVRTDRAVVDYEC